MRKSVIGILGVAALAASSFAIDNAVARDLGGGRATAGAPSVGSSHGTASSSFSHSSGVRSFGGRTSGRFSGSPTFQSNRNTSSFSSGRRFSSGGRDFDHDGRHHHHRRGFAFGVVPFYGDYYNDYAYDYNDDCYQLRRVHTRYGWRWRRIDVCGDSYY